jgi:hypothetical protein
MNCQFEDEIAPALNGWFWACAPAFDSATLREPMHHANGNGKLIPAFIAPFAVPPGR